MSSGGIGKTMTVELIHMKTKTNRVESIKNLNLWGNDLEDISIVSQMQALEVLSLAVNRVNTLKDIANCYNLRELYMRKNHLTSLSEVHRYLRGLENLRKLSLSENPLCDNPRYRQFVIKALPKLEQLDNVDITHEERMKVEGLSLEELIGGGGSSALDYGAGGISPAKKRVSPAHYEDVSLS